jgi:hypothetical protein
MYSRDLREGFDNRIMFSVNKVQDKLKDYEADSYIICPDIGHQKTPMLSDAQPTGE